MTGLEGRRAAVCAQLDALTEHELRVFTAYLAGRHLAEVELSLAEFLADQARQRETSGGMLAPDAVETYAAMLEATTPDPAVRRELHAEPEPELDDLPDSALPAAAAYVRGVIAELDEHGWRKARAAAADPETEAGQ